MMQIVIQNRNDNLLGIKDASKIKKYPGSCESNYCRNSNSGKTFICRKLIYKYTSCFNLILVCGVSRFEIDKSRLTCNIKISEEILNPFDYANNELIDKGILFILNDCFTEAVNTPCVSNVFF